MKIVKLSPATEKKLFKAREKRDVEAERVAAEIVADVRKRGDKALFAWTEKLDGLDLKKEGVWVSEKEISVARSAADKQLVRAIEHAARNVRRVAQQQLPKAWSIETELGVKISVGSSRVDLQACKLEYSIVSPK